jgi:hypothetical protein
VKASTDRMPPKVQRNADLKRARKCRCLAHDFDDVKERFEGTLTREIQHCEHFRGRAAFGGKRTFAFEMVEHCARRTAMAITLARLL